MKLLGIILTMLGTFYRPKVSVFQILVPCSKEALAICCSLPLSYPINLLAIGDKYDVG